jgi:ADP-ribose pyrophosphatase YjhB (NUDIX family)
MNPKLAYKFCPKCGGILDLKKNNLLVCKACGFEFFINAIPCNGVIIKNERGEIMLVKRKFPPMKGDWDWPGGFLDAGESVSHSVVREIKEELNVNVSVEKIIGVYEGRYEFGGILQYVICIAVSAKIVSGEIKVSDDVEEYKFFLPEEILRMDLAFKFIRKGIADYLKNP